MANNDKRIGIGESSLKSQPVKQLLLKLGKGVVGTDNLKDGAVTSAKLSNEIMSNIIIPLLTKLRDEILGLNPEEYELMIANDFGSSKSQAISQYFFTQVYDSLTEAISETDEVVPIDFWQFLVPTGAITEGQKWFHPAANRGMIYTAKEADDGISFVDGEVPVIGNLYINKAEDPWKLYTWNGSKMIPFSSSEENNVSDIQIVNIKYWGTDSPQDETEEGVYWYDGSTLRVSKILTGAISWIDADTTFCVYVDNDNAKAYLFYVGTDNAYMIPLFSSGSTETDQSFEGGDPSHPIAKGVIKEELDNIKNTIDNIDPNAGDYFPFDSAVGNKGAIGYDIGISDDGNDGKMPVLALTPWGLRNVLKLPTLHTPTITALADYSVPSDNGTYTCITYPIDERLGNNVIKGDAIGLQEGSMEEVGAANREALENFCNMTESDSIKVNGITIPGTKNTLLLEHIYNISYVREGDTISSGIVVKRDLRIEGGVATIKYTVSHDKDNNRIVKQDAPIITPTGGFNVNYRLFNVPGHSLELWGVAVDRLRGDDGYYGAILFNCYSQSGEYKPIDHVIVEHCVFPFDGLNHPNFRGPKAIKGMFDFRGDMTLSPLYNDDPTKLTKNNYYNHILFDSNTAQGACFITAPSRARVHGSFRIIENTITDVAGTAIGWNDGGDENNTTNNNLRSYVSCPIYIVGNTIQGVNYALRNRSVYNGDANVGYHCAFLLEYGVAYVVRNRIENFVTARGYNNGTAITADAADDIYYLGSQLYFVDNEIINIAALYKSNDSGTFKFKGVFMPEEFNNNTLPRCKYYNNNKYTLNAETVTNMVNNSAGFSSDAEDAELERGYFDSNASNYGGNPINDFFVLHFTSTIASNGIYRWDLISFCHNTINYPIVAGESVFYGTHACKEFLFSYNDIKCGKISSFSSGLFNTGSRKYKYNTDAPYEPLFTLTGPTYLEIINNKIDTDEECSVDGICLKYWNATSVKLPLITKIEKNSFTNNSSMFIYALNVDTWGTALKYTIGKDAETIGLTESEVEEIIDGYIYPSTDSNIPEGITPISANFSNVKDNLYNSNDVYIQDIDTSNIWKLDTKGSASRIVLRIDTWSSSGSLSGKTWFHGDFSIKYGDDIILEVQGFNYTTDNMGQKTTTKSFNTAAEIMADLAAYINEGDYAFEANANSIYLFLYSKKALPLPSADYADYSLIKTNIDINGYTNGSVTESITSPDFKSRFGFASGLYSITLGARNIWSNLSGESITADFRGALKDIAGLGESEVDKIFLDTDTEEYYQCMSPGGKCKVQLVVGYGNWSGDSDLHEEEPSTVTVSADSYIAIRTCAGRLIADGTLEAGTYSTKDAFKEAVVKAFRTGAASKITGYVADVENLTDTSDAAAYYTTSGSIYVYSIGGLHWYGNMNNNYPPFSLYIDFSASINNFSVSAPYKAIESYLHIGEGCQNGTEAVWKKITPDGVGHKVTSSEVIEQSVKNRITTLADKIGALEQQITAWEDEIQLITERTKVLGDYNLWFSAEANYYLGDDQNQLNQWYYRKGTGNTDFLPLKNLLEKLDKLTTQPSNPETGAVYIDTSGNYPELQYYVDNTWKTLGTDLG